VAQNPADVDRYRANLQGEIDSAAVYRAMASAEKSEQLASVYTRLAQVEERQSAAVRPQRSPPSAAPRLGSSSSVR
jgi:hypothetical protein